MGLALRNENGSDTKSFINANAPDQSLIVARCRTRFSGQPPRPIYIYQAFPRPHICMYNAVCVTLTKQPT